MVGHPFGLILDFLFNAVAAVTVQPWNPELVEQPATAEEILRLVFTAVRTETVSHLRFQQLLPCEGVKGRNCG